jgi:hypothetical protein
MLHRIFNETDARNRFTELFYLLLRCIGLSVWGNGLTVLVCGFFFFGSFGYEAAGRNKKDKCENQGTNDVVLKGAAIVGPDENIAD